MESLKSGVLVKFLEDMKMGGNNNANVSEEDNDGKPMLLQIRSIIPVLEEGDLWPNRGFYLKVSDVSHATYVSLPEEKNEMILANKLKLGQFIYVEKLEDAHPFPLLRGVTPLPSTRPCDGTPEDIVSVANYLKILEASNSDCIVEKGVISENRIIEIPSNSRKLSHGLSDPDGLKKKNDHLERKSIGTFRSRSASIVGSGENCSAKRSDSKRRNSDLFRELQKSRKRSFDIDSDTESILSSLSFSFSKRKSWNESECLGVKEIFDSSVVMHDIRPPRSSSPTVSPVCSVRYDSSNDNSISSIPRRREVVSTKKMKSSSKSKTSFSKINCEQASNPIDRLTNDRRGAETGISWDSLPSSLVKLGKEVVKQRDIALVAATDALQEACAAERLLNSLSKFSEFHLAEEDDLQPHVDKFFDLQDDMAHTRLILQSLTNISPLRSSGETDHSTNTGSVKEALTIAVQRKKNSSMWIKSAVALDLSPCSTALNPIHNTMAVTNTAKKSSSTSNRSTKPKGSYIIKSLRNNDGVSFLLSCDKDEKPEWTRGSTMPTATVLASSLQDECRKLFLGHIEKYLDEVEIKASSMVLDSQIAGMMYKVKRVNDWLDVIINKEPNARKYGSLDESEIEVCKRARNKIYGILLKHVERTAMAFGSSS
ncbi:hypothetical protein K7X08_021384 [Anisodus acutangulus]|uniref:Uncharacterized protein n=1 Tax=Anisodus acutangulus TaxID=402998 RepID=A0A9Q1R917_9SOLA|nr:hypothetical protein K7X08_021384 [Anisodus acutangulus]